jgi:hypothetical protein
MAQADGSGMIEYHELKDIICPPVPEPEPEPDPMADRGWNAVDKRQTAISLSEKSRSAKTAIRIKLSPDYDLISQLTTGLATHWNRFMGTHAKVQSSERQGDLSADLFSRIDEDQSGTISRKELRKVATELGLKADRRAIDALFDSMDADASGEVSLEEFTTAVRSSQRLSLQPVGKPGAGAGAGAGAQGAADHGSSAGSRGLLSLPPLAMAFSSGAPGPSPRNRVALPWRRDTSTLRTAQQRALRRPPPESPSATIRHATPASAVSRYPLLANAPAEGGWWQHGGFAAAPHAPQAVQHPSSRQQTPRLASRGSSRGGAAGSSRGGSRQASRGSRRQSREQQREQRQQPRETSHLLGLDGTMPPPHAPPVPRLPTAGLAAGDCLVLSDGAPRGLTPRVTPRPSFRGPRPPPVPPLDVQEANFYVSLLSARDVKPSASSGAPALEEEVQRLARQLSSRRTLSKGDALQAGWIPPRLGTPRSARDEYGANMFSARRFYPIDREQSFKILHADHRIVNDHPSRPHTGSLSAR